MDRRLRQGATRAALGLLIVVVLGADLYVLSQRNVTTQVGAEDVLADFRRSTSDTAGVTSPHTSTEPTTGSPDTGLVAADGAGATSVTDTGGSVTDEPVTPSVGATDQPRSVESNGTPAPAEGPVGTLEMSQRPLEGVYTYRTSGGEQISVADASHKYPERTYATVRHLDGCQWQHRSEVIKEHVDERVLCTASGTHLQHMQAREVEFFGKRDSGRVSCDPPQLLHTAADAPGATTTAMCHDGDDVDVELTRTTLGRQTMTVGGQAVDVIGFRMDGKMTGRVVGESEDELWIVATTGLTVRWERSVDTVVDAAFGARVRYREQATFELESLIPQR